jgi:CBS domain-containing protein
MRLFEMMSTEVETVPVGESAEVAWGQMRQQGVHHLIVMDRGQIVGVVSDRDMGGRGGAALRKSSTVADFMSADPVVASPETTVREAANLLRGRNVGCLPVFDGKKLVGIVTITDLLELLGRGVDRPAVTGKRTTLRQSPARGWKSMSH